MIIVNAQGMTPEQVQDGHLVRFDSQVIATMVVTSRGKWRLVREDDGFDMIESKCSAAEIFGEIRRINDYIP